jgi:phosphoribosylanthranilate isomerase
MKKDLNLNENTLFPSEKNAFSQKGLRLKICGMKYQDNISETVKLQPNYLGFIFYEKSSRFFNGTIPKLPKSVKKVGVFVNASVEDIIIKVNAHQLQAVQLHSEESPGFCSKLKRHYEKQSDEVISPTEKDCHHFPQKTRIDLNKKPVISSGVEIIKVFSIKDNFDFSDLKPYQSVCDYYLFDTKGKLPGGNGSTFNWNVLKNYPSTKPYFLSGGIGLDEIENVLSFLQRQESKYCYAVDVNSKFEIEPGLKNIELLEDFKIKLSQFE